MNNYRYTEQGPIRPFVVGPIRWLFSDTVRGAQTSANLYSLIEIAKAIEPAAHLPLVFSELPRNVDRARLGDPRKAEG